MTTKFDTVRCYDSCGIVQLCNNPRVSDCREMSLTAVMHPTRSSLQARQSLPWHLVRLIWAVPTSKEHVVQDGGNGRLDKSQQVEAHVSSRVC